MSNPTILVTGFDPFGGDSINPAMEAVRALPDRIGGLKISKLELPTVYGEAAELAISRAEALLSEGAAPLTVLCIGQAAGRGAITPEVIAINLREASIPDNAGNQHRNCPVIEGAPAAYFSTLPVREMVQAIRDEGLPASLSLSAGAFVCNDLMYTLLHRFNGGDVRVGFVHIPALPVQAREGTPSLPLADSVRGLETAIGAIENSLNDKKNP